MPRKRLTREEKRAMTREDVLEAAARTFPKRGYHAASVEEIAEEAGLSTGAVYSNFESKAELFLALYERYMERHVESLERLVSGGETPEEQIAGAGRHWLDFVRRDQDWLLLDVEFWAYAVRDPPVRDRYAAIYRRVRETATSLVDRATSSFGLELSASPEELGTMLNALATGLMIERLADPDRVSDDVFESGIGLLMRAATVQDQQGA
jgi:AcrR family transcriptional regulator